MELVVFCEPFNCPDILTICLRRKYRAAFDSFTVEMDRARTTLRRIAANVGAGQTQVIPQEVYEEALVGDISSGLSIVDAQRDFQRHSPLPFSNGRNDLD